MKTLSLFAAVLLTGVLSLGMPGFAADNSGSGVSLTNRTAAIENAARIAAADVRDAADNAAAVADRAMNNASTAIDAAADRAKAAISDAAEPVKAAIADAANSESRWVDAETERAVERDAVGAAGTGAAGVLNDPANISGSDQFARAENMVADRTGQIIAIALGLAILAGLIYWAATRRKDDYTYSTRDNTKTDHPDTKIYS